MSEVLKVGEAFCQDTEADELFAYILNERRYYSIMTQLFCRFEHEMKWSTHVVSYREARLFEVAHIAAQGYARQYCGRDAKYLELFPLEQIQRCANVMAKHFELENFLEIFGLDGNSSV